MKETLLSLAFFLAVFGLCGFVGLLLLRMAQLNDATEQTKADTALFSVPLGMGVLGLLLLGCGLIGFFSPLLFWILIVLGAISILLCLYELNYAILKWRSSPKSDPSGRHAVIAGYILALIAAFTAVAALAPPVGLEWDALSYHLANLKTWLRDGHIHYLPWDHHSNFPFTVQMLYLWMLGLGSIGGAKLIHWLCGVLLAASVFTFGQRYSGKSAGVVAALLVASTPIFLWEATVAYIDLATALFTWLSFYAYARGVETTEKSARWRLLSAVLMGFALGTKYTVLGFWGIGLLGVLFERWQATRKIGPTLFAAALWGGISLLIALPWYLKTALYTGNPVYPFAYSIFGGKYWSAENAALYSGEQAKFGLGKDLTDLLLSPWQVTNEPLYLSGQRPFIYTEYILYGFGLSPAFVALLLALPIAGVRLSKVSRACLIFGIGIFAFWFFLMQQTRYLIPALPFFAVPAAEMVIGLWERKAVARWFAGGLIALSVLWGVYIAGGMAFWGVQGPLASLRPVAAVVFGAISKDEFIARRLPGVGGASLWINANTDPKAKVALFDETRGFYLDRDYVWAQPNHAAGLIPWDSYNSADDWLNDFRKLGYTVLLLGPHDPNAPDDGQMWRRLFAEAEAAGKVTFAYSSGGQAETRVYLIP